MPARVDLTGRRIGRVVILARDTSKPLCMFWAAMCDCGNHFSCYSASLKRGDRFECKKCMFERRRVTDLTGRKYGRWTVIGIGVNDRGKTICHCLCDCGNKGDIEHNHLRAPRKTKSCGCWGRKIKSKYANTTLYPPAHGLAKSSFYSIRVNIIHKCYNEKHPTYHKFGAKGITVCDLWRNGAKDMYEWALSVGWKEKDVFCLKEGAKEFNPKTVYLIPQNEVCSMIGQSQGVQITYRGETHSIQKWAEIMDVDKGQLRRKIQHLPSVEEAFGSYFRKCKFLRDPSLVQKAIDLYESGMTQKAISKIFGVTSMSVRYHLVKHGVKLREEFPLRKPEVKNEEIKRLLDEGLSGKEISRRLGVADTSIYNRIKRMYGIKREQ
jgi:hypothetical protein